MRVTAYQGQRELNRSWRKEGGGDEDENLLTNFLRNHELAGTWKQKGLFRTTWEEYMGGYGINIFSCAAVQPENYTPAGKLTLGPTKFHFEFNKNTDRDLVVTIVLVCPKLLSMSLKLEEDGSYTPQTSLTDNY